MDTGIFQKGKARMQKFPGGSRRPEAEQNVKCVHFLTCLVEN